jgi:hypothetical protein
MTCASIGERRTRTRLPSLSKQTHFTMNDSPPPAPIHVFVDVDDTLVRSAGTKRIPMPSVIQHVRELHAQGAVLYCWSAGGAEHARRSAAEFALADCFTAFLPKPNVFLDDQNAAEWPRSLLVHPSNCSGRSLDDYRSQLR